MAEKSFALNVLTPEQELYSGKAVSLTADALDGEIGILADHAPLLTVLDEGRIMFKTADGENREFKTIKGLLKASNNKVSALIYL